MTNKQKQIYEWLLKKPGYLKKSIQWLYKKCPKSVYSGKRYKIDIEIALKQAKIDFKQSSNKNDIQTSETNKSSLKPIINKKAIKRLYFDIETSPNIVYSWNIGYNLNLGFENIIKERSIICICYKWEGEKNVNYLTWNNGDDGEMIYKFYDILMEAEEILGHNSDKFDIRWFKTRCLYHGILNMPEIISTDTLKLSRKHFKFNSNRLDYIGRFLGLGKKINTGGFDLWKDVIAGDKEAMNKMVTYCQNDVILLEKVYNKLSGYSKPKIHAGLLNGGDKCSCPKCASNNYKLSKTRITLGGIIKRQLQCNSCNTYYTINNTTYENRFNTNIITKIK